MAADVRRRWNNRGANEVDAGSSRKDQHLLTSAATGVSINNRDFRFQPDTGAFEAIPGTTQYGRHRDDWGNWFGNFNPTWLWHYFLPDHYLTRNPHLAVKSTKQILANYDNATRLYPASRTRQRFNDHHQFNHVTSANSPTPYRDDLFGPDFSTSVFISDPVHNLVHREVLEPDGVTFKSRRAPDETNSEFLASTDNWFRPTMLKTGPDGALYVADMYRQVLEHPEWIPKWMQPRLDLRAGADQGRIYRVVPVDAARRSIPRLDQRNTGQLVAALDSPSGWQRDTAQRLLVHQRDPAAAAPLARLLDHPRAQTRLHALVTLDGLGRLTPELLVRALRDAHAAVREHAVRLSEPFLTPTKSDEALGSALLKLAEDPSIRVRYQLAFTLGEWRDPRAAEALVRVAARDRLELPMQTAVLSSATNHVGEMLTAAFLLREPDGPPAELIEKLLGLATALHRDDVIEHALDHLAGRSQLSIGGARQTSGFVAFLDALDRRHESFDQFKSRAQPTLRETLAPLEKLFAAARRAAARPDGLEAGRLAAIPLLGRQDVERADDLKVLSALLGPANSTALQQAAVRALTRIGDEPAGGVLLGGWKGAGPQLRQEILNALLGRAAWLPGFVTEMERGQIPAGQISPAHQQALLKHGDQSIRARAEKLFTTIRPDRAALLQEYAPVNKLAGDEIGRASCRERVLASV